MAHHRVGLLRAEVGDEDAQGEGEGAAGPGGRFGGVVGQQAEQRLVEGRKEVFAEVVRVGGHGDEQGGEDQGGAVGLLLGALQRALHNLQHGQLAVFGKGKH